MFSNWYRVTVKYELHGVIKTVSFAGPTQDDAWRIRSDWRPYEGTKILETTCKTLKECEENNGLIS